MCMLLLFDRIFNMSANDDAGSEQNGACLDDDAASFGFATMETHLRSNTGAPILLAQALHAHLAARDAEGAVVNLLDQKLWNLNPDFLSYTLSKAALEAATGMLALALAPRVRVVENMVARAIAKSVSTSGGPACKTCHVKAWFGAFFDGTNNHRSRDFPLRHSNVVALFDAHRMDDDRGCRAVYYEGCGTEFDFPGRIQRTARVVGRDRKLIWTDKVGYDEEESRLNQAFGLGIDLRLEKAIFDFELFLDGLRKKSRVDEINVSAFGFSRGAATARALDLTPAAASAALKRLEEHAAGLLKDERPTVLAGDWNVVPEDRDVFSIRAAANARAIEAEARVAGDRVEVSGHATLPALIDWLAALHAEQRPLYRLDAEGALE